MERDNHEQIKQVIHSIAYVCDLLIIIDNTSREILCQRKGTEEHPMSGAMVASYLCQF